MEINYDNNNLLLISNKSIIYNILLGLIYNYVNIANVNMQTYGFKTKYFPDITPSNSEHLDAIKDELYNSRSYDYDPSLDYKKLLEESKRK